MFIGVITNLVFALALTLAADRRSDRAWAGQLIYVLMNGGLVVFVVGLVAQVQILKQIGAPAMGIGPRERLAIPPGGRPTPGRVRWPARPR